MKKKTASAGARRAPLMESMEDRKMMATFAVTTTADSGAGSLRDAITKANKTSAADVIQFKIGSGLKTITPTSSLPYVKYPVTIDGTTQGGYNGTKPLIEIRGDKAGSGSNGFILGGGGSTVKGLIINRFSQTGILVVTKGGNTIKGNWIGLSNTGTSAAANKNKGIVIQSSGNTIGGTGGAKDRNVISGNTGQGIQLYTAAASGNKVLGNYIGTDSTGAKAVANTNSGVAIAGGPKNTIGGSTAAARNVISGNKEDGVVINKSTSTYNVIAGNYIGISANGKSKVGNGHYGVETSSAYTTIGGATAAERNVVSGNGYTGVVLWLSSGSNNKVQNNYIGTDYTGKVDLGNTWNGVDISNGSNNNLVEKNVISGNTKSGVMMYQGSGNKIFSNIIGLKADKSGALKNDMDGIRLQQTKSIQIKSNTIGYNGGYAVYKGLSNTISAFSSNTIVSDALYDIKQS